MAGIIIARRLVEQSFSYVCVRVYDTPPRNFYCTYNDNDPITKLPWIIKSEAYTDGTAFARLFACIKAKSMQIDVV